MSLSIWLGGRVPMDSGFWVDNQKATCTICDKNIDISHGKVDIKKHGNSKRHNDKLQSVHNSNDSEATNDLASGIEKTKTKLKFYWIGVVGVKKMVVM